MYMLYSSHPYHMYSEKYKACILYNTSGIYNMISTCTLFFSPYMICTVSCIPTRYIQCTYDNVRIIKHVHVLYYFMLHLIICTMSCIPTRYIQ